jgi:hypothetical protein
MVLGLYVLNKRLTYAEAQALAERRADRAAG